jgi:integrase
MDDWNPHDLRRTVRTGLSRLGCPTDIAEAVLGHSKKELREHITCIIMKPNVRSGCRSGRIIWRS